MHTVYEYESYEDISQYNELVQRGGHSVDTDKYNEIMTIKIPYSYTYLYIQITCVYYKTIFVKVFSIEKSIMQKFRFWIHK